MDLRPLLDLLVDEEPLARAATRLRAGRAVVLGVADAAKPAAAALLWRALERPTVLLLPRESDAEGVAEQLAAWVGDAAVHFPARGALPYERAPSTDATARRIAALAILAGDTGEAPPLLFASAAAAVERTLDPADLSRGPGTLAIGERIPLEALAGQLVEAGYTMGPARRGAGGRRAPGRPARRLPPRSRDPGPHRVVRGGHRVDPRLRAAQPADDDAARERRGGPRDRVARLARGAGRARRPARRRRGRVASTPGRSTPNSRRCGAASCRRPRSTAPCWRGPRSSTISRGRASSSSTSARRSRPPPPISTSSPASAPAELAGRRRLPESAPLPHAPLAELAAAIEARTPRALLARWATGDEPDELRLPFRPAAGYAGRLDRHAADAARQLGRGDRVVVVTQQAQRYRELLEAAEIDAAVTAGLDRAPARGSLALIQGALPDGWELRGAGGVVSLVTDRELFGLAKQRRPLARRSSRRSRFLAEVSPGDFVVHADHGIARFGGLVRREVSGEPRDYLELRYAGGDRIYVPVEQVDRVARYVGPSDQPPQPHPARHGGVGAGRGRARGAPSSEWRPISCSSTPRASCSGAARSPRTTSGSRELEAAFPYEETADQQAAIDAVKGDMERAAADGSRDLRRRRLRQDRGRRARRLQGGARRTPGGGAGPHHRARAAAPADLPGATRGVPGPRRGALPLPHRRRGVGDPGGRAGRRRRRADRDAPPALARTSSSRTSASW